jgi:hypothetical protein
MPKPAVAVGADQVTDFLDEPFQLLGFGDAQLYKLQARIRKTQYAPSIWDRNNNFGD